MNHALEVSMLISYVGVSLAFLTLIISGCGRPTLKAVVSPGLNGKTSGADFIVSVAPRGAAIITGLGEGGYSRVRALDRSGGFIPTASLLAYSPEFRGGVRVAAADFDRDGITDIVTGAGVGGTPHVRLINGRNGGLIAEFLAYDQTFTGGVYVAAGDVNGDGTPDVITGAGAGGG